MTLRFPPGKPIILWARLTGPNGSRTVRLLLDTGAVISMVRIGVLVEIGVQVEANRTVLITSASDVQSMPLATVSEVQVGKHCRHFFPVIAHDLPALANIDGLLGIDFLKELHLSLRMGQGILVLEKDERTGG